MTKNLKLFFSSFLVCMLNTVLAQSPPQIKKTFEWSRKGYYILNPALANTENEVVFALRFSGKDSTLIPGQIANIAEDYINKKNRKVYNPLVGRVDCSTNKLSLIDYGWAPVFSSDDKQIAYAYQHHDIEKADKFYAASYLGNSIKVFNRENGAIYEIAKPVNNYLLDPFFLDSVNVVYKTGDRVNGPYGSGISLSSVNISTKKTTLIRQPVIKYRLYDLIGEPYLINNKLAYTVYSPADSGGGVASEYLHLLLSSNDTLQNFGIRKFTNLSNKFAYNGHNEWLFLDDEHFMAEDTNYLVIHKDNELLSKKPLPDDYVKGYLSPHGKYLIYITQNLEVILLNTTNFSQTKLEVPKREIHAVVWNTMGNKLAIVQDHEYVGTDVLYIFSVQ